ncbi:hypothetical protein C4564_02215 [Candidatus Microgenomates bacterium]|nr:MAG: hypothetical protein C4564_02215 [Candidatus Microgenomates bacterium]
MKRQTLIPYLLIISYIVIICTAVIYSFTQIDLNLTLSTNQLYQQLQQQLIQVGYFNRPLSATILSGIFVVLFLLYASVLWLVSQKHLSFKHLRILIAVSLFLLLSYPAFSHDVFNYLFDARMITKYGVNPEYFKASDFVGDEWVRFMHWTHRYYPYGPGWLLITVIPSFLGLQKFVLTLGLFKLVMGGFHAANIWLIFRLSKHFKLNELFTISFYALNPLVLIEGLVTPHNELVMLTFALLALYLLVQKKSAASFIAFVTSVSIKFISIIILPLLLFWNVKRQKLFQLLLTILWFLALIPLFFSRELYSWYLLPVVGLSAISGSLPVQILTISLSIGFLSRYIPIFLIGDFIEKTTTMQTQYFLVLTIMSLILQLVIWFMKRSRT